jgi:AcrR family transcriptional regulator
MAGDAREQAILAGAERLFERKTFREISVDDLASAAGLSRSAFYFYFASKEHVLLSLLDRLVEEQLQAEDAMRGQIQRNPAQVWREVLSSSVDRWMKHPGIFTAAVETAATSAEVRQVWGRLLDRFVTRAAEVIQQERAAGKACPGPPARDLAVCLVRMNERVFDTATCGAEPLVEREAMVDALLTVWLATIYGAAGPGLRGARTDSDEGRLDRR